MSLGLFLGLGALAGLVGFGIYTEEKKGKVAPIQVALPPAPLPPMMVSPGNVTLAVKSAPPPSSFVPISPPVAPLGADPLSRQPAWLVPSAAPLSAHDLLQQPFSIVTPIAAESKDVIALVTGNGYFIQAFVDESDFLQLPPFWGEQDFKDYPGSWQLINRPKSMKASQYVGVWRGPSGVYSITDSRVAPYSSNGINTAVTAMFPVPPGTPLPGQPIPQAPPQPPPPQAYVPPTPAYVPTTPAYVPPTPAYVPPPASNPGAVSPEAAALQNALQGAGNALSSLLTQGLPPPPSGNLLDNLGNAYLAPGYVYTLNLLVPSNASVTLDPNWSPKAAPRVTGAALPGIFPAGLADAVTVNATWNGPEGSRNVQMDAGGAYAFASVVPMR